MAKFFQEKEDEPNDMVRRRMDLVELQQVREQVIEKSESHQHKFKITFDKKGKGGQLSGWRLGPKVGYCQGR